MEVDWMWNWAAGIVILEGTLIYQHRNQNKYWCMVPHLPPREVLNSSQEIILFFLGVFLWLTGCSYPQIFRNPKYFQLPGPQRQDKRDRERIGKEYTFDGCHIISPSQILKESTTMWLPTLLYMCYCVTYENEIWDIGELTAENNTLTQEPERVWPTSLRAGW